MQNGRINVWKFLDGLETKSSMETHCCVFHIKIKQGDGHVTVGIRNELGLEIKKICSESLKKFFTLEMLQFCRKLSRNDHLTILFWTNSEVAMR